MLISPKNRIRMLSGFIPASLPYCQISFNTMNKLGNLVPVGSFNYASNCVNYMN